MRVLVQRRASEYHTRRGGTWRDIKHAQVGSGPRDPTRSSLSLQLSGRWRCKLSAGRFLSPGGYCLVATPAICGERGIITACLAQAGIRTSAGNRCRPYGHVSERATQRLEAGSALVLVRRSYRGGARALPRHSELWSLARTRRGNLGICSSYGHERGRRNQSRGVNSWSKEAPPVVGRWRCGVRAIFVFSRAHWAPTSERGWGASLNLTRTNSLDAPGRCGADGADLERQRCRGRAARRRVRWFASRDASASLHTTTVNDFLTAKGWSILVYFFFF